MTSNTKIITCPCAMGGRARPSAARTLRSERLLRKHECRILQQSSLGSAHQIRPTDRSDLQGYSSYVIVPDEHPCNMGARSRAELISHTLQNKHPMTSGSKNLPGRSTFTPHEGIASNRRKTADQTQGHNHGLQLSASEVLTSLEVR